MSLFSTFINAETHDYEIVNGIISINNLLLTEAYSRIVTPLGTYQFDTTFGCELPNYINTRFKITSEFVTTAVNNALRPMIADGRALTVVTTVNTILLNGVIFTVDITDNDSNVFRLPLNLVGTT